MEARGRLDFDSETHTKLSLSFDVLYLVKFGSVFGVTIVKQCVGFICFTFFYFVMGLLLSRLRRQRQRQQQLTNNLHR